MDQQEKLKFKVEVARIAASDEMRKRALAICRNKMDGIVYGHDQVKCIAEDSLCEVATKLLGYIDKDKNLERLRSLMEPSEDEVHPIASYLARGVLRHCDIRSLRWLPHPETGRLGVRARLVIGANINEGDFWDQHIDAHEYETDALDVDKVDALLVARGLKEKEIFFMKRRLENMSWVDMAATYGDSPDKYRRLVERACIRTNLEHLLPEIRSRQIDES